MTVRKLTGYILLGVSCIAFGVLPIIPFLPIDGDQKLAWAGGVFVFAEVTWWVSMPLLGPEIVALIKKWWDAIKAYLGRSTDNSAPEEVKKTDA